MPVSTPILTDICWTLYRSNTTFDFLDSIINKKSYRYIRALFRTRVGRAANILLYRLTRIDIQRVWAIRYLKGISKDELAAQANAFVDILEKTKRIEPSFLILAQEQHPIILLSGTLDCIAQAVGRRLHAQNIHSSELEYKDGICTGRLSKDLLLRKSDAKPNGAYYILTDNRTDIELVRAAKKAYVVCYNNQEWWEKQQIEHIEYVHEKGERY